MWRISTYVGLPARAALSLPFLLGAQAGLAGEAQGSLPFGSGNWAISAFGGVLTEDSFVASFCSAPHFDDSYIGGTDLTYTYFRLPALPINLELDATAAKRFGQDNQ